MTQPPGQAGDHQRVPAALEWRQRGMLALLTATSFVVVLDYASVVIPLPSILAELGGTLDAATWVIAGFVLTFAVLLVPCAALADRYGARRLLITGVAVFTAASAACALAPSIGLLIGARVALGIGAAMAEPAVFTLLGAALPRERQQRARQVHSLGFLLGGALAPILSGAITTGLGWRFVFWLDVGVGVVVLAAVPLVVPASRPQPGARGPELPCLAAVVAGLGCLTVAVIQGARLGWGSAAVVGLLAAAAVGLALFAVAERRARMPLVDPVLRAHRSFTLGSVLRGLVEFASLGVFFALSHYLQVQLGYPALATGLLLMSVIAGALVASPLAEARPGRADVRWLVVGGFVVVAAGSLWVAHVTPQTGWGFFLAPLALFGAGIGMLETPLDRTTRQAVPAAHTDAAWQVSYVIYLLGIGLGVAVVSAVWQTRFISGVTTALPDAALPPAAAHRIIASLGEGGVSGEPAARLGDLATAQAQQLVEEVFATAVNTALLACAVVALLGAAVALLLTPNRKDTPSAAAGSGDDHVTGR